MQDAMFSSDKMDWSTPSWLIDVVLKEFPITLDACSDRTNNKFKIYLSEQTNALAQSWLRPLNVCDELEDHSVVQSDLEHRFVWMNPPYGRKIIDWVRKATLEQTHGVTTVALLPARVDTKWWWDFVRQQEVRFLRGRLKFGGADNSAPFPSAIVIFYANKLANRTIYWENYG